mmetsp:Transcript_28615/g.42331  ORF Transcript_28615/g.42331 Transcript_28615/m.42331 type:complete len:1152 (-) Transcript_28615:256-3711(-)|eukprot:CAMPEP_0195538200 /NCGR_PEP_ID=MMETSP0794_2-20130614/49400_1 /TAXON_ID=515487 /ORGANISM="Stephanopyxis turris, Strain CCMP 815" /LENGTH=1151 /DNA_ID=CAMNT_0040672163 /DNA_START=130 /DNA_END=3585 /DNA_ORIENTATION=-
MAMTPARTSSQCRSSQETGTAQQEDKRIQLPAHHQIQQLPSISTGSLHTVASATHGNEHMNASASISPRIIAGYSLQTRLGSGSFAYVFKGVRVSSSANNHPGAVSPNLAHRESSGREMPNVVAVKAITRSHKLTKKVLENLEMEISILQNYHHGNIVEMFRVEKTLNHFYLILEYCGGGDLQRLIRTRKHGRLSERLTRRLMRDLTAGLTFLYEKQLIHRDIKPQNLLLTGALPLDETEEENKCSNHADEWARQERNFPSESFSLKIADFGFARHLQTSSLAETLCGSPLYMAPEILQHQRYDAKADLWSAGTVLFEMIAGKPPFHGENHIDLLRNIQRRAVKLPPGVKISPECIALLRMLLNRNPLSRASFKQFFKASGSFVALGCNGMSSVEGNIPSGGLDGIAENEAEVPNTACSETNQQPRVENPASHNHAQYSTTTAQSQVQHSNVQKTNTTTQSGTLNSLIKPHPKQEIAVNNTPIQTELKKIVSPDIGPNTTASNVPSINVDQQQPSHFTPLVPSPPTGPMMSMSPLLPAFSLDGNVVSVQGKISTAPVQQHHLQQAMRHPLHRQARQQHHSLQAPVHHQSGSSSSSSQNSLDEFVIVEHNTGSTIANQKHTSNPQQQQRQRRSLSNRLWNVNNVNTPPPTLSSSQYPHHQSSVARNNFKRRPMGGNNSGGQYPTQHHGGMLSTSPNTGGKLLAMMGPQQHQPNHFNYTPTGRTINSGVRDGSHPNANDNAGGTNTGGNHHQSRAQHGGVEVAAKMLAAAEDVGRRAVNVAHLGDTRAYIAMRIMMTASTGSNSSILSSCPMEGVEEENEENNRISSDLADNNNHNYHNMASGSFMNNHTFIRSTLDIHNITTAATPPKITTIEEEEGDDEMPFALSPPSQTNEVSACSSSVVPSPGSEHMPPNHNPTTGPSTTATIHAHFREALSCYIKALPLMKGAVTAAQRVNDSIHESCPDSTDTTNALLASRCEVSLKWLAAQFNGILERADSANGEIQKLSPLINSKENDKELPTVSVEELIYNHALACGRDGAVKQLLGQYDAARTCYRSAGLLAETLLMEPRLGGEDRAILEGYVNGFSERIREVDRMLHNNQNGGNEAMRGTEVVGIVGGVPHQQQQNQQQQQHGYHGNSMRGLMPSQANSAAT